MTVGAPETLSAAYPMLTQGIRATHVIEDLALIVDELVKLSSQFALDLLFLLQHASE